MNIKVKDNFCSKYNIQINTDGSVKDLKLCVKKCLGLNEDEQTLLYGYTPMDNEEKKLREYGIEDGSEVKLIINCIKEKIHISVYLQGKSSLDVEIMSSNTLIEEKKKVQHICKLFPDEQIWVFNGTVLEGNNKISSYGIQDNSLVIILHRLINVIQIFAKTMDGKTVAFEVRKNDKIIDIKKKIQEKIGLCPDEQKLVYQGGILEDDKTVDECNILERSVINVVARLRGGMQIFVKMMDGKTVAFEVRKNDKIIDIKKKFQEKIGLCPEEQKLVYQGGILEDDKTVYECGIVVNSIIHVVVKRRSKPQSKTSDGKTFTLEVTMNDKVIDIKKQIKGELGLCPDEQRLVYEGCVLEDDDKTVEECNIEYYSIN